MAGDKQQVFPDFLLLPCQPKIKAVGIIIIDAILYVFFMSKDYSFQGGKRR